jgi:hypothetical protein
MLMTVLISPGSGFQIIGLFANSADAQSYAKGHSLKDWRVAEVISPPAFAESQAHITKLTLRPITVKARF